MKKKLVKALLSATLVLSILGSNFSYVGARNVREDTASEVAEEVTTDVVESEALEGTQAEGVNPEENILLETETGDGHSEGETQALNSELADGENAEAMENEPEEETEEEEIPEITEESLLSEGRNVPTNNDQVCQGGGKPDNSDKNPHQNGKANQDPRSTHPLTNNPYWDHWSGSFTSRLTEQQLIDRIWPWQGQAGNKWKLRDAVITPLDQCYFANQENGWGEHVHENEKYLRWDAWWGSSNGGVPYTPRPNGIGEPHLGKPDRPFDPNYIGYTGNYYWINRNGAEWAFRIVTRPVLEIANKGHYNYYNPSTSKWEKVGQYYIDGNSYPRVKDRTGYREKELEPTGSMYQFRKASANGYDEVGGAKYEAKVGSFGSSPTVAGWYNVTIQTPEDKGSFILPGVWKEKVMYMNKGYRMDFKQSIDNQELQNINWKPNDPPAPFDSNTKDLFGINMYLHQEDHKIPEPSYDSSKYIFEGWEAREKYWVPGNPNDMQDDGRMETRVVQITQKDNDGKYIYTPTRIGDEQFFVLDSMLVAKLRTRKTNTINVKLKFIEDESTLKENEKAVLNKNSIQLVEQIQNNDQFTVLLQDKPFDFLGYSKSADGTSPLTTNLTWKPGEKDSQVLPDNQLQTHMTTEINAVVRPKQITIKLDPNGGQIKGGGKQLTDISTYYYKSPRIHVHNLVNGDLVLKGWSEDKNATTPDVITGSTYKVEDKKVDGKYPSEKTLYAVWGKATATVHAEKYKDVLFYPTDEGDKAANNIYTKGGGQINAYELGRFYLDVEPAVQTVGQDQSKLDPSKFLVVFEHSSDGKTWEKIKLNDDSTGSILTKAFSDSQVGPFAKVIYDKQRKKWFAPLLGRLSKMNDENSYKGFYRVNVAYDDDAAAEEVSTEEEFFNKTGNKGWSESDNLQVRVVQSPDAFINVPSTITLEERTEVNTADGTTKEIIESVHSSNKVTVVPFEHDDKKTDYDWLTPNNALVENRTGSYNNQMHEEFIKNKPFYVSIDWSETLTGLTGGYTINNIKMYSASNIGTMKKDEVIPDRTKNSFTYDGKNTDKTLFDFYLKGDKPKGLPEGLQLKGRITFTVSPIAQ